MPKVTVIIPTFNRSSMLKDAIQSVLNQTFKDFELVVVDNSSTDNTSEVVQAFQEAHPNVKYVVKKDMGLGPPHTMHVGIENAQGEYVHVLCDDDLIEPEFLTHTVAALEVNPDAAFVFCDSYEVNEFNSVTKTYALVPKTELSFSRLIMGNCILLLAVLLRKKVYFSVGGLDMNLCCTQDWDLWLRIAKKHRFIHIDKILTRYRVHSSNVTAGLDRYLRDDLAIYKKKEIIEGVPWPRIRFYKARIYMKFTRLYKRQESYLKTSFCYLKALTCCPWIGFYYWPPEAEKFRFTLPYRILKIYWLVVYYYGKHLKIHKARAGNCEYRHLRHHMHV